MEKHSFCRRRGAENARRENAGCKKLVTCGTDGRLRLSGFQALVTLTLTLDRVIWLLGLQTVSDVFSERVCSLDTSASNALGVLDDNEPYKSIFLLGTYLLFCDCLIILQTCSVMSK